MTKSILYLIPLNLQRHMSCVRSVPQQADVALTYFVVWTMAIITLEFEGHRFDLRGRVVSTFILQWIIIYFIHRLLYNKTSMTISLTYLLFISNIYG